MTTSRFVKATKSQSKLRMGLIGPAGAGKSYSALAIASGLSNKVAVLDTENGSASKYSDLFSFDTVVLNEFSPRSYIEIIKEASSSGYGVLVIDSLSHAWVGKGGVLEMADSAAKRSKSGNTFAAWRDVTPEHNALVDAIIQSPLHIIATLRTKTEYVIEMVNGRSTPKKVGLEPVTGKGLEYEFDIVIDLDDGGQATVTKTRYSKLSGKSFQKPGQELGKELSAWLSDGATAVQPSVPEFESIKASIQLAKDKSELMDIASKIQKVSPELINELQRELLRNAYNERNRVISTIESEAKYA